MVDDHQLIIDGLMALLKSEDEILVAGVANNGREALQMLHLLEPDLVLMDIDMPVMNGIDALREIKKKDPSPRVIILSMHGDEEYVRRAILSGARGYLRKDSKPTELGLASSTTQPSPSHHTRVGKSAIT